MFSPKTSEVTSNAASGKPKNILQEQLMKIDRINREPPKMNRVFADEDNVKEVELSVTAGTKPVTPNTAQSNKREPIRDGPDQIHETVMQRKQKELKELMTIIGSKSDSSQSLLNRSKSNLRSKNPKEFIETILGQKMMSSPMSIKLKDPALGGIKAIDEMVPTEPDVQDGMESKKRSPG